MGGCYLAYLDLASLEELGILPSLARHNDLAWPLLHVANQYVG